VHRHLEFNKVILLPTHGKTQGSSAYVIYMIVFLCWALAASLVLYLSVLLYQGSRTSSSRGVSAYHKAPAN